MQPDRQPEFSVILNVELLGESVKKLHLDADETQRAALAERFELLSVDSLTSDLTVVRIGGGDLIHVRGRVEASIVQACVVSGAPVAARISELIDEKYGPPVESAREVEFSIEIEDPPEPIIDNEIDLGEIVAQYLGVAIDPYPRVPGVEIPGKYQDIGTEQPETPKNPFLVLASLKKSDD